MESAVNRPGTNTYFTLDRSHPKLTRNRSHSLPLEEAKGRIDKLVGDLQESYPALIEKIDWNADRTKATVKGKMFTGDFKIDANVLDIKLNLSFLAKPFMGRIEQKIDTRLDELFA